MLDKSVGGHPIVEATQQFADHSDDKLVESYLLGQAGAFDALYARYKGPIYRFFLRQLPTAQANDAFQETWTKLISNLSGYQPRGLFSAYIFRLAHNVVFDHHRRVMRDGGHTKAIPDSEVMLQAPAPDAPVDEQVSQSQLQQLLDAEIRKLPINQRTVWLIKQETNLSLADIATLTGSSVEGVKSRLRYATDKLKAGLKRYV
jgi:RNA polymerase sigma-70 factor, ECF subfamily